MYFVLFETFYQRISLSIKFFSHKSNPTLNTSFEFNLDLANLFVNCLNKQFLHLEHGRDNKGVAEHGGEAGGVQGRGQEHAGHLGSLAHPRRGVGG